MAEGEVNYASVVFKSNKHPSPKTRMEEETVYDEVKVQSQTNKPTADTNARMEEETVYDEVKVQSQTNKPTADTNVSAEFLPDKKANNRHLQYQQLACCLGILCVILLLGIIAVVVYFATLRHEIELTAANRNLTNLNKNLILDNEKLRRDNNNLTVQLGNLTQNYTVLESKITNLNTEVQNLTRRNQQLETQSNNLTDQIQDMETNWNKLNVSRAQWSIDAYCPKENSRTQCKACLTNFELNGSNCYIFYKVDGSQKKTWEEARQVCRGRSSDLVVVHSIKEQNALNEYSRESTDTIGYWFGLRAEGGRWKWIDGSDLTVSYWKPQPPPTATDGQCAMSVQNVGWISVSCAEKQRWICEKKALSV